MPKGLSDLMGRYKFAELEWSKPACKAGKWVFVGAHNAGNDAVATIKVAIAQALDLTLRSQNREASEGVENLPEDWYNKPLQGMYKNILLLAYDSENTDTTRYKPNTENRTTEHGFAWWHAADCMLDVPPGLNEVNWHAFIQARHWINKDFLHFENKTFVVGKSKGFWKEFGKSQLYDVRDGPAPFHALFEELAANGVIPKLVAQRPKSETIAPKANAYPPLTPNKKIVGNATTKVNLSHRGGLNRGSGSSSSNETASRGGLPSRESPSMEGDRSKRGHVPNENYPSASPNLRSSDNVTLTTSTTSTQSATLITSNIKTTTKTSNTTRATFSWAQVAGAGNKTNTRPASQL